MELLRSALSEHPWPLTLLGWLVVAATTISPVVLGSVLVALIGSGVAIYLARANKSNLMVNTATQVTTLVRGELDRMAQDLRQAHERIAVLEAQLNKTEEATSKALQLASEATAEALRVTSSATAEALQVSTTAASAAESRIAGLREEITHLRDEIDHLRKQFNIPTP